jgi:hypothetical protein
MATVYWDLETYSQISLTDRGVDIYAADPATGIFFFCYAIDDGEVQVWRPGDPVPEPFANPTGYKFVSDNWEFEHAIHASILVTRCGFPTLPTEQRDCAQRLALANAYPAELGLRCEALGLPYCKSPEARKAICVCPGRRRESVRLKTPPAANVISLFSGTLQERRS